MRNLHLPGRSPVRSLNGMAATSHPLSTWTAVNVLSQGGNAIDAAVAAGAVQCVVEPESTGIGGDCFVLCAPGGKDRVLAYNGSGRAPMKATPEWYAAQGIKRIEQATPHAVTVPGAVDAWARLVADHGSRPLGELLQPAIRFAREGYPLADRVAADWALVEDLIDDDPVTRAIFKPAGRLPRAGEVHRQPKLAATLEHIARKGRDGFYSGPVAEDIVARLRARGGLHTMDDFATAAGEYVTPIRTTYRGFDVIECPPNGQGIVALMMLNILSGFDLSALAPMSVERLHLEIEAARLAYRDRDDLVGDPAYARVPVQRLLSAEHAAERRALIRHDRAMGAAPSSLVPEHADTVYITVVDKDRNAVSFINSLFSNFGCGITAPETGVVLHSRGSGFALEAGHPNCIGPGKRPLHTIIPGMVAKAGRVVMPFGVMGGHFQAVGHVHFLTNLLDFGLDIQESIDLARVFPDPRTGKVEVEDGVPAQAKLGLQRLGHQTTPPAKPIGGGQAIWIDWDEGVLTGGSEPRKDGCALGY